jgi:hypothetical protein
MMWSLIFVHLQGFVEDDQELSSQRATHSLGINHCITAYLQVAEHLTLAAMAST